MFLLQYRNGPRLFDVQPGFFVPLLSVTRRFWWVARAIHDKGLLLQPDDETEAEHNTYSWNRNLE